MIGIRINILDGSGLTGSTQMWLDVAQKYLPSKSIDRLYLINCFPFINGVWRQKMFSWVYFVITIVIILYIEYYNQLLLSLLKSSWIIFDDNYIFI